MQVSQLRCNNENSIDVFKFTQKKSNKENEQNIAEAEEEESAETEEKHEELDSVKEDGQERTG